MLSRETLALCHEAIEEKFADWSMIYPSLITQEQFRINAIYTTAFTELEAELKELEKQDAKDGN